MSCAMPGARGVRHSQSQSPGMPLVAPVAGYDGKSDAKDERDPEADDDGQVRHHIEFEICDRGHLHMHAPLALSGRGQARE